jgi:trans-aconitate 2-methyltransferase
MRWDPAEYLRFADERGRPFVDLMARVRADEPSYVLDLGCGPGNLTSTLAQRWPAATVVGVDSSAEMIERARSTSASDRVAFVVGDLRTYTPDRPVDVLTSNATLQWVPQHVDVLPRLVDLLAPDGWLAAQVPGNFAEPSHTELHELLAEPRWRARLADEQLPTPAVEEPTTYIEMLSTLGCRVDALETTYFQLLQGVDTVLAWLQGTALRPVLSVLDEAEQREFLAELAPRLRAAYRTESFGTVLPYRRIFFVAQREG